MAKGRGKGKGTGTGKGKSNDCKIAARQKLKLQQNGETKAQSKAKENAFTCCFSRKQFIYLMFPAFYCRLKLNKIYDNGNINDGAVRKMLRRASKTKIQNKNVLKTAFIKGATSDKRQATNAQTTKAQKQGANLCLALDKSKKLAWLAHGNEINEIHTYTLYREET